MESTSQRSDMEWEEEEKNEASTGREMTEQCTIPERRRRGVAGGLGLWRREREGQENVGQLERRERAGC
jgi:hypothetical protein